MEKDIIPTKPRSPKVTVLMPVFNGEKFLREAVESILSQTFTDFEFLIIDDGSVDRSVGIIRSYHDRRIRLIRNEGNLGIVPALNKGIDLARGEYIARMDCDDISLPHRLERQTAFLDAHRDIGACGSWIQAFSENWRWIVKYPASFEEILCSLFYNAAMAHPSVMMRTALLRQYHLYYDQSFLHAEDFELWVRAVQYTRLENIPEVLLRYRKSGAQITSGRNDQQMLTAGRIRELQLNKIGIYPTEVETNIHNSVFLTNYRKSIVTFGHALAWYRKVKAANREKKVYPEPCFSRKLKLHLCRMLLIAGYNATMGK
jgi:glycosyltransferase involved in cell wall biosynthesis